MNEIRRLNEKVKGFEGSGDIIDPEVLKDNMKKFIAKQKKEKPTTDGADRHDDDRDFFDNEFVPDYEDGNLQKHFSGNKKVRDKEEEQVRAEEDEQLNDKQQEVAGDAQLETGGVHMQQEVAGEAQLETGDVHMQQEVAGEAQLETGDVHMQQEVAGEAQLETGDVHMQQEVAGEAQLETGDVHMQQEVAGEANVPLCNYMKRTKKTVSKSYVIHRSRAPSTRATKRSQLVRTPFTEQRKPKSKGGEHKDEPLVVPDSVDKITVYYDDNIAKWDVLKSTYLSDIDRAALKNVNEGIPDVAKFSLRVLDSTGAFVHNYRIPKNVAAKLTAEENKWLTHYCKQKYSQ